MPQRLKSVLIMVITVCIISSWPVHASSRFRRIFIKRVNCVELLSDVAKLLEQASLILSQSEDLNYLEFATAYHKVAEYYRAKGYSPVWVARNFSFIMMARAVYELQYFSLNDDQYQIYFHRNGHRFANGWANETKGPGVFAYLYDGKPDRIQFIIAVDPHHRVPRPWVLNLEEILHARFQHFIFQQVKFGSKPGQLPPYLLYEEHFKTLHTLDKFVVKELQHVFGRQKPRNRALLLAELAHNAGTDPIRLKAFTHLIFIIAEAARVSGQSWENVSLARVLRLAFRISHQSELMALNSSANQPIIQQMLFTIEKWKGRRPVLNHYN